MSVKKKDNHQSKQKKSTVSTSKTVWIPALCIFMFAVVAALIFMNKADKPTETSLRNELDDEAAPIACKGNVIDATDGREVDAVEGSRYRVSIDEIANEGPEGIAHIGGLVTFVPDGRVGDKLIIEVTKLKGSTAEASIVKILSRGDSSGESVSTVDESRQARHASKDDQSVLSASAANVEVEVGRSYRGKVEDIGDKGDGIVRVGGKVVFIEDAERGEEVVFRVTQDKDKFAIAVLVESGGFSESEDAEDSVPAGDATALNADSATADDVQPGRIFNVMVAEKDRRNPSVNGVARIGGLVVFIHDSQPGDKLSVRITERAPSFAQAEKIKTDLVEDE